ncbi:MAG: hypothetical protein ABIP90_04420 [Vicinamibacterales bacterium]
MSAKGPLPLFFLEDFMEEEKTFDRREFTLAAAMAALSGVVITISACSGGSTPSPTGPGTPPPPGGGTADKTAAVSENHGHAAVITGGQLSPANALTLDIRGAADHAHIVTLSAAEVSAIARGETVSKESTFELVHRHTVRFN